jgi:hypothetical protein
MSRSLACLAVLTILGSGLALPRMASAQARPTDRSYCDALIDKYRAYVYDPDQGRPGRPNAEHEVAISQCRGGDTANGIPPLEKALRDARINLPPRG